jgi:hypothetical protein
MNSQLPINVRVDSKVRKSFDGQLITIIPPKIKGSQEKFRIHTSAIIDHSTSLAYPGESALQILSALKNLNQKEGLVRKRKEEILRDKIAESGYPESVLNLIRKKRIRCTTLINGGGGNHEVAKDYIEVLSEIRKRKSKILRRKSETITIATILAGSASANIFCSTSPQYRYGLEKTKLLWHAGACRELSKAEEIESAIRIIEEIIELAQFADDDEEREWARRYLMMLARVAEALSHQSIVKEKSRVHKPMDKLEKDKIWVKESLMTSEGPMVLQYPKPVSEEGEVEGLIHELNNDKMLKVSIAMAALALKPPHELEEELKVKEAKRVADKQTEIKNFFIKEASPRVDLSFIDQQLSKTGDVIRTGKELHEMGMMYNLYSTITELRDAFERVTGITQEELPSLNIKRFFMVSMIDEALQKLGYEISLDFNDDGTLNPRCINHLTDDLRQQIYLFIEGLDI